jgi:hypothetical protein
MKIGQLVMLIRTQGDLPPTGATGVIHDECCMTSGTRVMFALHKQPHSADGAFCVRKSWLIPIDDDKGKIASEDQQELDLGDGRKVSQEDLVKLGKRLLEDEPA